MKSLSYYQCTMDHMMERTATGVRLNSFHATGLYIGFWPIPGFCRFEYFFFDELSYSFQDFMDSNNHFSRFYKLPSDFFSIYKSMYMF